MTSSDKQKKDDDKKPEKPTVDVTGPDGTGVKFWNTTDIVEELSDSKPRPKRARRPRKDRKDK